MEIEIIVMEKYSYLKQNLLKMYFEEKARDHLSLLIDF